MTTDKIGKLLDTLAVKCFNEDIRVFRMLLEERLGPLLRAGQAMRDWDATDSAHNGMECRHGKAWDAALATLEGRE